METRQLPQSDVATLPPREAGVISLLTSPAATSARVVVADASNVPWHKELSEGGGNVVSMRGAFTDRRAPVAIGRYLAEALDCRWQSYCEQLGHCQEHFSEEAVHELRVATRRLLAQLTLLGFVSPGAALEKARRTLKRRLAVLGDLRDVQVQRAFIDQQVVRFPELVLLCSWLERRERRLVKSAAREVKRHKTKKLEKWISELRGGLLANRRGVRAQSRLATVVLRATAKAHAEAVERRQAIDLADLRTIHQTRVAFKRFRYTVESLSPTLTGLSKRRLRTLAYYQRKMGIIQDLEVLRGCLARYVGRDKGREELLRPFCRHLGQRRARALRSFLKSADRIFGFWPPDGCGTRGAPAPRRNAA